MTPLTAPDMSQQIASALVDAAAQASAERGLALAFAVVDRGGNQVASLRMDGAQLGALGLAIDKAYTAAAFGFPSAAWTESSAPGGSDWGLSTVLGGRIVVFPGGVPVYADGVLIGGLGVSGTASTTDEAVALSAVAAAGLAASR